MKQNYEEKSRAVPCRWTHSEHQTLIALLKKRGKKWVEIAEVIGTKNEQQCRTHALLIFNKLKKCNFDNELYQALAETSKTETKLEDLVRFPNGEIKLGKNGKPLRKRKKPVSEVKDEHPDLVSKPKSATKEDAKKKRSSSDGDSDFDDKRRDGTYRGAYRKPAEPMQRRTLRLRGQTADLPPEPE